MAKGLKHRADNDPRAAALLALIQVMGGTDSQAALDRVLAASVLVPSDKALATELFYGTLRHHLRLRWFLEQKLAKPDGLPEEMILLLEQTMYELAHTRIPAHAGVNWAVGLVRGRFGQGLSKVANGVLRSFERGKKAEYLNPAWYAERLGLAPETSLFANDSLAALYFAVPLWMAQLWKASYSKETYRLLLEASLNPAPQAVRLNMRHSDAHDCLNLLKEQGATQLHPGAWLLPASIRLPISVWIKSGAATRQSPAAYAALFALQQTMRTGAKKITAAQQNCAGVQSDSGGKPGVKLKPDMAGSPKTSGERPLMSRAKTVEGFAAPTTTEQCGWGLPIWDACAGRGGKTLALMERGIAVHTASDPSKGRIKGLEEDYRRLGLTEPHMPVILAATAQEAGFVESFRTVLVDAPCSGLGTLSHRPEIRWRRTEDDIARLAATQAEIMEAAHRALRPEAGSAIVYMTCTMTLAENQELVSAFLGRHPEYELELECETPPDAGYAEFFYGALIRRK